MLTTSCHCGAVRLEIARSPRTLTQCNCSICRRYGAIWSYHRRNSVQLAGRRDRLCLERRARVLPLQALRLCDPLRIRPEKGRSRYDGREHPQRRRSRPGCHAAHPAAGRCVDAKRPRPATLPGPVPLAVRPHARNVTTGPGPEAPRSSSLAGTRTQSICRRWSDFARRTDMEKHPALTRPSAVANSRGTDRSQNRRDEYSAT